MKKLLVPSIAAVAGIFAFASCEVKQTEEGEMPEVEVKDGNMPEYDVDGPDVDVDTKEVEVPDTITVPDVDIAPPGEEADAGDPE